MLSPRRRILGVGHAITKGSAPFTTVDRLHRQTSSVALADATPIQSSRMTDEANPILLAG
jgi:hypothetical protein